MRKFYKIAAAFLIIFSGTGIAQTASGQAQIQTKKVIISDLTEKTTKVVLTGNSLFDSFLMGEFKNRWRMSPYEFCTLDEFQTLKTDSDYYFLIFLKGQFRKETEPGISFMSMLKGGPKASEGTDKMLEVASIPFAAATNPNGRETTFLPALLDIFQVYIRKAIGSDIVGYTGLAQAGKNIVKAGKKRIYFSESDLEAGVDESVKKRCFDSDMLLVSDEEADSIFSAKTYNTLVSYTVAPSQPVRGSYCYKMLIDAETHVLYYYKRHSITGGRGAGFLSSDLKKIHTVR